MNKKKVSSNIQTNHTFGEYQRYFSHLLNKGKLHCYSLSEKNKLDPKRQYWKLTNKKGETYYYELPKYIKPSDTRTAYSLSRVAHRRPARIALAIFAGTAFLSITSAVVTRNIFSTHFPDVPPEPVNLEDLQKQLKTFQDWQKEHKTGDATKEFSVAELSNIAIANALYNPETYVEVEGAPTYSRRPLLTVGFGNTITNAAIMKVYVNVTNSFICDGINALEESISYSESAFGLVPKVGKRDFYYANENIVEAHAGEATSKIDAKWNEDVEKTFTKDDYTTKVGKVPDNPFLYSIDEDTVLSGSSAKKTSTGYDINIDLDRVKGVARYVKRMTYLSGKTVDRFYSVKINIVTDNDLRPITHEVKESYDVTPGLYTIGDLKTTFYYEDVPSLPEDVTTPFDYRPYQAE